MCWISGINHIFLVKYVWLIKIYGINRTLYLWSFKYLKKIHKKCFNFFNYFWYISKRITNINIVYIWTTWCFLGCVIYKSVNIRTDYWSIHLLIYNTSMHTICFWCTLQTFFYLLWLCSWQVHTDWQPMMHSSQLQVQPEHTWDISLDPSKLRPSRPSCCRYWALTGS